MFVLNHRITVRNRIWWCPRCDLSDLRKSWRRIRSWCGCYVRNHHARTMFRGLWPHAKHNWFRKYPPHFLWLQLSVARLQWVRELIVSSLYYFTSNFQRICVGNIIFAEYTNWGVDRTGVHKEVCLRGRQPFQGTCLILRRSSEWCSTKLTYIFGIPLGSIVNASTVVPLNRASVARCESRAIFTYY